MANTTAVYARIDTGLKEHAEAILSQLGISPSSAIQNPCFRSNCNWRNVTGRNGRRIDEGIGILKKQQSLFGR